jgi:hypothetical protein
MISTSNMEGELFDVYEHNHQVEFIALEHLVQTPTNEPFDHEDLLATQVHDFILARKVKMVDDVNLFPKIASSTLIIYCNNYCKYMNFQGLNLNFH